MIPVIHPGMTPVLQPLGVLVFLEHDPKSKMGGNVCAHTYPYFVLVSTRWFPYIKIGISTCQYGIFSLTVHVYDGIITDMQFFTYSMNVAMIRMALFQQNV